MNKKIDENSEFLWVIIVKFFKHLGSPIKRWPMFTFKVPSTKEEGRRRMSPINVILYTLLTSKAQTINLTLEFGCVRL